VGEIAEFFIFVALGEEIGFSAFALPRLLHSRSIVATVMILGSTRIIWHLPLFMTGDTEWPVALLLIPTQFIFTWIFVRSRGSALPLILAHLSIGTIGEAFFSSLFTGPDLTRVAWLQAAAFVITAVVLLRATDFMRSGSFTLDTAMEEDVQPVPVS
jgi:membrane protease YdiL (CAAX protease family)